MWWWSTHPARLVCLLKQLPSWSAKIKLNGHAKFRFGSSAKPNRSGAQLEHLKTTTIRCAPMETPPNMMPESIEVDGNSSQIESRCELCHKHLSLREPKLIWGRQATKANLLMVSSRSQHETRSENPATHY